MSRVAWGKLGRSDTDPAEHPLLNHCADVAAVVESLLCLPTISGRLGRLGGRPLQKIDHARLAVLTFLHDVGKANLGFQSKRLSGEERISYLGKLGIRPATCGHGREIAPLFGRLRTLADELLSLDKILGWTDGSTDLLLASISHHGVPIRRSDLEHPTWRNLMCLWRQSAGDDPVQTLRELGHAIRNQWPEALGTGGDVLPNSPEFVHAFAGLVSLADWIASNPEESWFPFDNAPVDARFLFARQRAGEVLRAMRIDMEDARADLCSRRPNFGDVFGFEPRGIQGILASTDLERVVVVEAETGAGKTEAALWRFKSLFEAGEVDSLAFVLPRRIAATAVAKRVEAFADRLFPDPILRPNIVTAVPGYLRVDGHEGISLAHFEHLWPDAPDEAAAHRVWAAENAKRYLAAAVAVGTVDQILLSGLMTRHAHLRGAALMRSLLVIDEVHASDTYMLRLLEGVVARHAAAGGHVLLMSATLGGEARQRLVSGPRPRSAMPDLAHISAPYPAITDRNGMRPATAGSGGKMISITISRHINSPNEIAALAADAARKGARVLVVRNTVAGVLAVQNALEKQLGDEDRYLFHATGVVAPHHGRFAAEDRRVLDLAVEREFGKAAPRGDGCILVGSQTLEISLDIDADFLITDLAPADVLLQRCGRLHRHPRRDRPAEFASAKAIVLTPTGRELSPYLKPRSNSHGIGTVYENVLALDATWAQIELRPLINIPQDNRAFVEAAVDPAHLYARAESIGADWVQHARSVDGRGLAQKGIADLHRLDWRDPWEDLSWPSSDEHVRTRLGEDDRFVMLPNASPSPFGIQLSHMRIPGWMSQGIPHEENMATDMSADVGGFTFGWGAQRWAYDRFGLRKQRSDDQRTGS